MLYCFELDGTIISGFMRNPNQDFHTWYPLPGRIERLRRLDEQGNTLVLVTNQGGVAFGFQSEEDVESKLNWVGVSLQGTIRRRYVAMHDVRGQPPYNDPAQAARRKPSGAMIREAMADFPAAARGGVMMVGDRPEDEAAAQDAGVSFQWAHEFFKEEDESAAHVIPVEW